MTAQGSKAVKKPGITVTGSARPRPRALVTGGAVRVGRAIAQGLARAGMDVAVGYHHSAREARATVRDLESSGVRALALQADLGRPAEARRLIERAAAALGGLDVLVNNAAVFFRTPFATLTPAEYDRLLDVNLRGVVFCCQAAAAVMAARGGHIVNVGDVATDLFPPAYIPYTVSKAGVAALTRSLAVALAPQRIAVNCVAPGAVLKPAWLPTARWKALTRGRAGSPDDVAAAVVFFATCPPHITGQILGVAGGEPA